ncbi:MAG: FAD-dependent oxidoreductase [bacterium]|nr:FAD-dependent oxidoreductase [bacterium]
MYDLVIIGTGPAGLSASIYGARYKMNAVTIGKLHGGTITEAHLVENYPGVGEISGMELGQKMLKQAESLGAKVIADSIRKIEKQNKLFVLHTENGKYETKRILLAMGAERTKLKTKGEEEFLGKGVAYCATCDGPFFKGKTVSVIGGGNAAVTAALYLGDITEKVYLIYRGPELKAEPAWIDQLNTKKNIEVIYSANIEEITGTNKVESIKLDNGNTIALDGVFIEIGSTPNKALITDLGLKTDDKGYIEVDAEMKTSAEGVWAAGDIAAGKFKLRQAVTATGEGALAVYSAYLDTKKQ